MVTVGRGRRRQPGEAHGDLEVDVCLQPPSAGADHRTARQTFPLVHHPQRALQARGSEMK